MKWFDCWLMHVQAVKMRMGMKGKPKPVKRTSRLAGKAAEGSKATKAMKRSASIKPSKSITAAALADIQS